MKVKTKQEIYFEMSTELSALMVFGGNLSANNLLKNIHACAKKYVGANKSLFIENEIAREHFDRFIRCVKYPYFNSIYSDGKSTDKYDMKAAQALLAESFNSAIIELEIQVNDKELQILQAKRMLSTKPPEHEQGEFF